MFRGIFYSTKIINTTFSTLSSSIKLGDTMKKLIDAKEYQKALDIFQQHPEERTNTILLILH